MPRPPSRSPVPEREADGLEELEELGDDAIISQQTAAHAPQPRANVSEESRSVVITDHPMRRDTEPPRNSARAIPPRSGGEQTLVIRDRRALDELRKNIELRKVKPTRDRRALYMWGALGLVAFVLGGVVAFLATDAHSDAPVVADKAGASDRVEAQISGPAAAKPKAPLSTATEPTHAVRLDDLPVETPSKH